MCRVLNSRETVLSIALVLTLGLVATPLPADDIKPRASHKDAGGLLSFSPDGKSLALAGPDDSIKMWDIATTLVRSTLKNEKPLHWGGATFSPDGKWLARGAVWDKIQLWDLGTQKEEILPDESDKVLVPRLIFSPDGKILVSGNMNRLTIWDVASRKRLFVLKTQEVSGASAMEFSPDGKTFLTFGCNGTVQVWDVATGTSQSSKKLHRSYAFLVAISPDCKMVAAHDRDDERIKTFDIATGKVQSTCAEQPILPMSMEFSPDGKTLAVGFEDGSIKLFDPLTGKERHRLLGHTDRHVGLAFSPDGKTLASGGEDKTIRLWDLPQGK